MVAIHYNLGSSSEMTDTCLALRIIIHPENKSMLNVYTKNCRCILTKGPLTSVPCHYNRHRKMSFGHALFWKHAFSARCMSPPPTPWPLLYSIYTYLSIFSYAYTCIYYIYMYIQYIHIIIHPPNQQKNEQASQAPRKIPWIYMFVGKIGLHPWFSTGSGLQANGILKHLAVVSDHRPPFSNVRVPSWHSIESWLFNRDPYIYLDECLIFKSNVGKYTIHGFYGFYWLVHDGILTMASCSSPT